VRKWLLVGGLIVVAGAAAAGAAMLREEPEEKFCITIGRAAATPAGLAPLLEPGQNLILEDLGEPGDDGCDPAFFGNTTDPYVRADDCVIVYPDGWSRERPVSSIEPFNPDGTCWLEPQ
jgi:hypothetical protein